THRSLHLRGVLFLLSLSVLTVLFYCSVHFFFFFFFNDTATTEIYTLSLHDALPISVRGPHGPAHAARRRRRAGPAPRRPVRGAPDRKSTRLNSSHVSISYAVFCLKKKKNNNHTIPCNQLHALHCFHTHR